MNFNPNQPPESHAIPKKDHEEQLSRRGFLNRVLRGVGAGVVIGTVGGGALVLKEKSEAVELYKHLKGQEKNFSIAIDAIGALQNKMESLKIDKVRISGDMQPDEEISILRDYLQAHLNAKGVGYKYGDTQKDLLQEGYFTMSNLDIMRQRAEKARDE